MTTQEEHNDDIALAGEYVLHLLSAPDRQAFERRITSEPALRDAVRNWESQLVVLTDEIAPVTPPSSVKTKLENRLFPASFSRRQNMLQWLFGATVAAGLVIAAVLLVPNLDNSRSPQSSFTALIASEDGALLVTANFITQTRTLAILRETGGALPGRVLELWLIADGAAAPVSLGVLPQDRETRLELSEEIAQQIAGGVLAISDEPVGGSQTGAPTGAVLAAGPVTSI